MACRMLRVFVFLGFLTVLGTSQAVEAQILVRMFEGDVRGATAKGGVVWFATAQGIKYSYLDQHGGCLNHLEPSANDTHLDTGTEEFHSIANVDGEIWAGAEEYIVKIEDGVYRFHELQNFTGKRIISILPANDEVWIGAQKKGDGGGDKSDISAVYRVILEDNDNDAELIDFSASEPGRLNFLEVTEAGIWAGTSKYLFKFNGSEFVKVFDIPFPVDVIEYGDDIFVRSMPLASEGGSLYKIFEDSNYLDEAKWLVNNVLVAEVMEDERLWLSTAGSVRIMEGDEGALKSRPAAREAHFGHDSWWVNIGLLSRLQKEDVFEKNILFHTTRPNGRMGVDQRGVGGVQGEEETLAMRMAGGYSWRIDGDNISFREEGANEFSLIANLHGSSQWHFLEARDSVWIWGTLGVYRFYGDARLSADLNVSGGEKLSESKRVAVSNVGYVRNGRPFLSDQDVSFSACLSVDGDVERGFAERLLEVKRLLESVLWGNKRTDKRCFDIEVDQSGTCARANPARGSAEKNKNCEENGAEAQKKNEDDHAVGSGRRVDRARSIEVLGLEPGTADLFLSIRDGYGNVFRHRYPNIEVENEPWPEWLRMVMQIGLGVFAAVVLVGLLRGFIIKTIFRFSYRRQGRLVFALDRIVASLPVAGALAVPSRDFHYRMLSRYFLARRFLENDFSEDDRSVVTELQKRGAGFYWTERSSVPQMSPEGVRAAIAQSPDFSGWSPVVVRYSSSITNGEGIDAGKIEQAFLGQLRSSLVDADEDFCRDFLFGGSFVFIVAVRNRSLGKPLRMFFDQHGRERNYLLVIVEN